MKRKSLWIVPLGLALLGASYPKPIGQVNDFANIIPDETEQALEARLRDYAAQTSIEIAVVTVSSLDGDSVEDFTVGLAKSWGVGKKGKDNGVVFLHAPTERKIRIEVGYGLEPDLPDVVASRIIRETIVPAFKRGDLAGGTTAGVEAILTRLGDVPYAQRDPNRKSVEGDLSPGMIILIVLLMIVILVFVVAARVSTGGGYYSGSYGGSSGSSDRDSGGWGGFGGGGFGGGGASGSY